MSKVVCCTCGRMDKDCVEALDWSIRLEVKSHFPDLDHKDCKELSMLLRRLVKKLHRKECEQK